LGRRRTARPRLVWHAVRARAPIEARSRSLAARVQCCDGSLRRTTVLVALGKNLFDFGVRAGNDVYGHEFTDAPRSGGPGVWRGFHGADVAAHHHGHIGGADVFLPTSATSAVFTIASAASSAAVRPLVSISPKASNGI